MTLESQIDSFWELTLEKKIAYLFNRTALGLGVIVGLWHLTEQHWWEAFLVFGVMFPFYFWLHRTVDAP